MANSVSRRPKTLKLFLECYNLKPGQYVSDFYDFVVADMEKGCSEAQAVSNMIDAIQLNGTI